jgi:hypothetical protein
MQLSIKNEFNNELATVAVMVTSLRIREFRTTCLGFPSFPWRPKQCLSAQWDMFVTECAGTPFWKFSQKDASWNSVPESLLCGIGIANTPFSLTEFWITLCIPEPISLEKLHDMYIYIYTHEYILNILLFTDLQIHNQSGTHVFCENCIQAQVAQVAQVVLYTTAQNHQ